MSRPPKRTHEDRMPPPPHGQAATENEPNKRSRRRKRARHREKERAQSGRDLSTTEQITPLDLAEMELAVATAQLNVGSLETILSWETFATVYPERPRRVPRGVQRHRFGSGTLFNPRAILI